MRAWIRASVSMGLPVFICNDCKCLWWSSGMCTLECSQDGRRGSTLRRLLDHELALWCLGAAEARENVWDGVRWYLP